MTGFNDMTTSNHCGFFLDLTRDVLLKGKATTIPSPFKRQLKSKSPKSVRKYKHYLQKQVIKNNIEKQIEHILITSKQHKLTQEEEIDLNRIDQLITKIMLKAEKCINNQQHNFPWSPALHDAIRIVSIWKSILSQFKTKLSFQKQITFYLSSLSTPINIDWFNFAENKRKLRQTKSNLRKNKTNAKELRTQHLLQRVSAINIENKTDNSSTIINIQKIEHVILIWNKFNYLTSDKKILHFKQ